jgi:thioredoxin reductase (NADPH)
MTPHPPGPDADAGPADEGIGDFDVAVVGLGPAGIIVSTELVRFGYGVVAFERGRIGGLIHLARRVDNYPGAEPSCPGTEVVEVLWEHLRRWPPAIQEGLVDNIYHTGVGYGVSIGDRAAIARAVVLATGTNPNRLGLPGEDLPWVRHSWTDITDVQGGTIAVIGGGDLAVDQALSLQDAGHRIEMLLRSEATRCNRALAEEMEANRDIHVRSSSPVLRFEMVHGPTVVYAKAGKEVMLPVDAVLVSIGREPELPQLNGTIMSVDRARSMAPQGLFVAGDVISGRYRQVAIAMGNGLSVAMRVDEYLRGMVE